MSQITQFQWQESHQGFWHREIDECEQFYWLYTNKEHGCYPITGCASFQVKDVNVNPDGNVETALRSAWTSLRYKHPTLGSRIEPSDQPETWKRVYRSFETDENVKAWLDSTFKIVDTDKTALSWFNSDAPPFHMPTVYFVKSKLDTQQIVFLRCPHDITDGVGILQLLDQLFVHAATFYGQVGEFEYPLPDTDLGTRLSPSLRVAAPIPDSLSEDQMGRFQELQTTNGKVYSHPGLLGLPTSVPPHTVPDVNIRRTAISVSKSVSNQVLVGCKKIAPGVSLTHVFTSALTMALSDLQPRKDGAYTARYVDRPMINIRPYCRKPFNTPDHAVAAYHAVATQALGIDVEVPGIADDGAKFSSLPELAVEVRDLYQQLKPDPLKETYEQALFAPWVFQTLSPPPGVNPWAIQESPFCPVSLSSIGNLVAIVDSSNELFDIANVWVASQSISAGVAVFLASWDSQIELSSVFNTQYHSEEYVEAFLEKILTYVFEGLGVVEGSCESEVPE